MNIRPVVMTLTNPSKRGLRSALQVLAAALTTPFALMRTPLIRNGYALVANTVLTSALGLVFWVLAARLYTVEQVGIGGALISTMMALSNIAQLNLGNLLNRFLPTAGSGARVLILFAYAMSASAALIVAICFLFVVESLVTPLGFLTDNVWIATWFVVSTVAWTVFALQDSALAGLRQAVWVPFENFAYAVAKLGALVLLAGTAVGALGPFVAWTIPLIAVIGLVNPLMFRFLLPGRGPEVASAARLEAREMARFFGWDYAGTLAMMATLGFAPLLVLQIAGPGANANYHLAWTIAYSLYLIGRSMGTSLLAEGVADRARLPSLAADTFVYTMLPVTAAAALVIGAAPLIMGLFGPAYADEGTPLLRVLALSTVPWALSTIYLALVRANGRMVAVALVEGATLLLVLGLGALLLPRMGVLGIGIAWLVTNTGVAIAIAIVVLLRNGFEQTTHLLLGLTPSITGSATALGLWRHKLRASVGLDPALDAFLRKSCLPGAASFRPLQTETSSNEVTTVTLGVYGGPLAAGGHEEGPETARLLLKTAKSQRGVASLERYLERLQTLRRERRLDDCGFGLPEILAVKQTRDAIHLVERAPPGEDGQTFLQRRSSRADALSAAVRCIALLHDRTAAPARIGESWLADWIDRPIDLVGRALSTRRQREAFDAFRREQYAFWHEQVLRLGWGHGDFGPAHIVFAAANRQCGGRAAEIDATVSVEGIINWSTARADTPAGLDACHLALATHALVQGVEFSQIVSRLLVDPAPVLDDDIWLACTAGLTDAPRGWPHDTRAIRAMVGLAWLNHSIARLDIANGHAAQRLWTSSHVEQVVLAFSPDRAAGEK